MTKDNENLVTNKPTNHGRQGCTGGNRRLAQWRVKWIIEHSTSHQHLWCIDSFVLRNPPLRQAANQKTRAWQSKSLLPNGLPVFCPALRLSLRFTRWGTPAPFRGFA